MLPLRSPGELRLFLFEYGEPPLSPSSLSDTELGRKVVMTNLSFFASLALLISKGMARAPF